MSGSNWRTILAVIGLALLASSGQAQERENDPQRSADKQQESAQPFSIPIRIVESPEAAEARQSAENESAKREKEDLVAQQGMNSATERMADYAFAQTILIFIGTGALIYTLFLTRQANKAAQAAVVATRETGRDQARAYVNIDRAEIHFRSKSNPDPRVMLWAINSGQTPARWFVMKGVAMPVPVGDKPVKREIPLPKKDAQRFHALAAGGENSMFMRADGEAEALASALRDKELQFHITGMVRYETVFGEVYDSWFSFFTQEIGPVYETVKRPDSGSTYERPKIIKMQKNPGYGLRVYHKVENTEKDE